MVSHFNDSKLKEYKKGVSYTPFYSDNADYNTNAPSYYEYLARYNGFISSLVDFVNGLSDDIEDIKNKYEAFQLSNEEVTYTVGSEGDFVSLNDCFDKINDLIVQPVKITVILLQDYIMTEQLFLENKRYNHVIITSDKDIVKADSTRLNRQILIESNPIFNTKPLFYGKNSHFPTIDFKLENIDTNDEINVGYLMDNSDLTFTKKGGATYFNFIGVCGVNGSNVTGHYCDFSHNGNRETLSETNSDNDYYGDGVRIFNSTFSGNYSSTDYSGNVGYHFSHSASGYIDKSTSKHTGHHGIMTTTGSTCSARECVITDVIDDCVVAYASSKIDLRYSDTSRAKINFGCIATRTSEILFDGGTSNGCGRSGIMANRGCTIDATNATANNNNENGIHASNNSQIDFSGGSTNNNGKDGMHSAHGSVIQARNSESIDNTRNGVLAYISTVYCQNITVSGNGNRGLESTRGGFISAYTSQISNSGDNGLLAFGGRINVNNSTISNSGGHGMEGTRGSTIVADNVTITDSSQSGIMAYSSKVTASNCSISGSGDDTVFSTRGGEVVIFEPTLSSNRGTYDFALYNAGRIFTNKNSYSSNVEDNSLTNNGIFIRG